MIAKREGIGDILVAGSYLAAEKFGMEANKYCMTSKKMDFAAHEPRGKWNVGLAYVVSPNGADHIVVEHDHCFLCEPNTDPDAFGGADNFPIFPYGIREPLEPIPFDSNKLRAFVVLQKSWSLTDTLDICIFVAEPGQSMLTLKKLREYVGHITGWSDMTLEELVSVSEREIVISRLFNAFFASSEKGIYRIMELYRSLHLNRLSPGGQDMLRSTLRKGDLLLALLVFPLHSLPNVYRFTKHPLSQSIEAGKNSSSAEKRSKKKKH